MPAAPVRVYGYWEDAEGAPALGTVSLQRMDTIQDVAIVIIGAQVEKVALVHGAIDTEVIGCDPDDPNPLTHFYRVTERIRGTERAVVYDIEVDADSPDVDLTAVARVSALPDPLFTYEPAGAVAGERDRALAAEADLLDAIPVPSDVDPEPLGTTDPGTSGDYSRGDHVHDMPSATDVGAATPADVTAAVAPKLDATDPSVTNARTPTAHKTSHATGGTDPLTPGDIGAATAVQGGRADSALQADDIGDTVQAHSAVLDGTTASFTTADETKLDGIAAGAEQNVQSDWTAPSGDAHILNKPTLGTAAAADTTDFATAAQGGLAGSAVQPGDTIPGDDVSVDLTDYLPALTADNAQDGIHSAFAALVALGGSITDLYGEIGDANTTIGLVSDAAAAADETLLDLANHAITQAASRIPQSVRFSATAVPAQTVTAADRIGAGLHTWPDGNIGFANLGGTIYAFAPNGVDSARNTATPTNLRGTVQQAALALSTIEPADYAAGGDVYVDTGTGKIIKLWHGETQGADPMNFRSFHGLAVASTGSPDAWTDLGRIITPADGLDPADGTHDLANNSMLVYGSHMYVFFSERTASTRGAFSVARAPLADVITWANGGAPATFLKYHLGAWTEPGIGGDSTEVMPGVPYPAWGSVIRVSGLADRFVMVWTAKLSPVGIEGNQWAVYAAMSEPGSLTSWGEPELIIGPTPSAALYYPTLADATDLSTHVSDATTMKLYLVSSAAGAIGSNPWADAEVLVYDLTIYNGRTDTQGGLSRWFDGINDVNPVTAFGSFLGSAALGFGPTSGALDILWLRSAAAILVMQFGNGIQIPKLTWPVTASAPAGPNVLGDLAVISGVLHVCTTAGTPGTWTALQTATVGSWVTPTLTNSWANAVGTTRYRRIGRNEVEIDLAALMSGASGSSAFTLPTGFRPAADEVFYVYTTADGSDLGQGQVTIKTNGNVEVTYLNPAKPIVTGRIRMMTV